VADYSHTPTNVRKGGNQCTFPNRSICKNGMLLYNQLEKKRRLVHLPPAVPVCVQYVLWSMWLISFVLQSMVEEKKVSASSL
jgi:hypothetical protein